MKILTTLICILSISFTFAQDKMFVHRATTDNINTNWTIIDHPDLNNNPNACLSFVQRYEGVSNDAATGIWYSSSNNRWNIYNEDQSIMPEGIAFNVLITDPAFCFDHVATEGNSITELDNSLLNGDNPGPYAFFSKYFNPNSIYNDNQLGVAYNPTTERRIIFEENFADIPVGSGFKVLIPNLIEGNVLISHMSDSDNINGNSTILDVPLLNGNPDATFLFTHYWGVEGAGTQVYIDANLEVEYVAGRWAIYGNNLTEDFPDNVAFDIIIRVQENLNVENISAMASSVYPNPTSGITTIQSTNEPIKNISVYDVSGREINSFKGNNLLLKEIDLSSLQKGNYILKLDTQRATQSIKIIKK